MARWSRRVPGVRADRGVTALGGLYVAAAVGRILPAVIAGEPAANVLFDFVEIAGPGSVLLYGGIKLPRTGIHPDAYSRILLWCVGTAMTLLGVVGLLIVDPDLTINQTGWAALLATAIGNVGGLAIGANEARAVTRAREAREHERRLERQNDRLESFASMLAHELRNPLNVAQIYLQSAADGDEEAADEVATALDRIEEMIEILLVTARGTDSNIDRERVALSEMATDAWADLATDGATLVVDADRTVWADPVHVRHLLENLFRNAVEHGATDVTVRVGDLPDGFYVVDDGRGIPAEERETVFEAGYTTDERGLGLGLTFVGQLAETYGWDCELTEGDAGGARFEFRGVEVAEAGE